MSHCHRLQLIDRPPFFGSFSCNKFGNVIFKKKNAGLNNIPDKPSNPSGIIAALYHIWQYQNVYNLQYICLKSSVHWQQTPLLLAPDPFPWLFWDVGFKVQDDTRTRGKQALPFFRHHGGTSAQLHHLFQGHLQLHGLQGGGATFDGEFLQQLYWSQHHLRKGVGGGGGAEIRWQEWQKRCPNVKRDVKSRLELGQWDVSGLVSLTSFFHFSACTAENAAYTWGISCHRWYSGFCSLRAINQYWDRVAFLRGAANYSSLEWAILGGLITYEIWWRYVKQKKKKIYHTEILL